MQFSILEEKLSTHLWATDALISQCRMPEPSDRTTPAFTDPKYLPFYFYLGQQATPKKIIQIGPKLGLVAACFLQARKERVPKVERWDIVNELTHSYKPPIGTILANTKMHAPHLEVTAYSFRVENKQMYDLAFLTEKFDTIQTKAYLNYLWDQVKGDGLIVVDYIEDGTVRLAFDEFCLIKHREPYRMPTRYGVGIIIK